MVFSYTFIIQRAKKLHESEINVQKREKRVIFFEKYFGGSKIMPTFASQMGNNP